MQATLIETFSPAEANQPSMEIHLLLGESATARDNSILGRFLLGASTQKGACRMQHAPSAIETRTGYGR